MLTDPMADHLIFKAKGIDNNKPPERLEISSDQPLLSELEAFFLYLRGQMPTTLVSCKKGLENVELVWELHRICKQCQCYKFLSFN